MQDDRPAPIVIEFRLTGIDHRVADLAPGQKAGVVNTRMIKKETMDLMVKRQPGQDRPISRRLANDMVTPFPFADHGTICLIGF